MRDRNLGLALAASCGLVLVLGLVRISTPSLWVDEAFTARAMGESLFSYLTDQYHWLYYTLMKPWTALVGTSELAIRFPSVIGAMLACALLVLLAHRLFGSWVALASGLLIAASPFVVKWSQQARGYTLMLALTVLATLLLVLALERGTRGAWALYGVALAAAVVWHPVGGFLVVPAHLVLAYQRRERVLPHGLLAGVIVCALALPWAGQIAIRSAGEDTAIGWLDFPSAETATWALLDVSGPTGIGLLLALLGLGALWLRGDRANAVWLGTWAFAPFVLSLVVSLSQPVFLDRYLIVATPSFALLGGIAVVSVARRARPVLAVAIAAVAAIGLVRWYDTGSDGNWRGEDWRGAVAAVLERRSAEDSILVAEWSAAPAARYYGADVVDVSTADSIWVLRWTEEGRPLAAEERGSLGFGEHMMVESLDFGSRVDAQRWVRTR